MEGRPGGFGPPAAPSTQSAPTTDLTDVDEELTGLPDRPLTEHVQVFAKIHQRLIDALGMAGSAAAEPADVVGLGSTNVVRRPGQPTAQRGD